MGISPEVNTCHDHEMRAMLSIYRLEGATEMTRKGTAVWEHTTTRERLEALLGEKDRGFIHGIRHSRLYISNKESNAEITRLSDGTIEVRFYATVIVRLNRDDSVWLNNGGYATMSTHRWMNALVPEVSAHRVNWASVYTPRSGYRYVNDDLALMRTTGTIRKEVDAT